MFIQKVNLNRWSRLDRLSTRSFYCFRKSFNLKILKASLFLQTLNLSLQTCLCLSESALQKGNVFISALELFLEILHVLGGVLVAALIEGGLKFRVHSLIHSVAEIGQFVLVLCDSFF